MSSDSSDIDSDSSEEIESKKIEMNKKAGEAEETEQMSQDNESDNGGTDDYDDDDGEEKTENADDEGKVDDDDGGEEKSENADEEKDDEVRIPVLNPISVIKNKERRNALYKKLQLAKKKKQKSERRRRRRETGEAKSTGHTIESLREPDQTTVTNIEDSDNEELRKELELDDFSEYFERSYTPKVLITFADNPVRKTRKFGLELSRILPNSLVKIRNRSSVKKIVESAKREEFTDVIIINEDRNQPNGLLIIHLPNGPTAHFKLSSVKLTSDIKRNHKEITKHRPEVVLTNFTTRLGLTIGRMLGALFHHDPEFKGRRAVTFHNQRDYIFFRHHRYEFAKNGERVKLRELGPRFTLKLRSLQEGTFNSKCGDYTWIITNKRHNMEARRRFFL